MYTFAQNDLVPYDKFRVLYRMLKHADECRNKIDMFIRTLQIYNMYRMNKLLKRALDRQEYYQVPGASSYAQIIQGILFRVPGWAPRPRDLQKLT